MALGLPTAWCLQILLAVPGAHWLVDPRPTEQKGRQRPQGREQRAAMQVCAGCSEAHTALARYLSISHEGASACYSLGWHIPPRYDTMGAHTCSENISPKGSGCWEAESRRIKSGDIGRSDDSGVEASVRSLPFPQDLEPLSPSAHIFLPQDGEGKIQQARDVGSRCVGEDRNAWSNSM